jgi:hypothetical protein
MMSPNQSVKSDNEKVLVRYIDQRGVIQSVNVSMRTNDRAMIVATCNKINAKKGRL